MYTIGSDPEFFVMDKEDSPCPAFDLIGNSKKKPLDVGDGFQIFYDNVLIEGNIPPANSSQEFIDNIKMVKSKINHYLQPFEYKLLESDSQIFLLDSLKSPKAKEFGCDPYMNAWTFQEEIPPCIRELYRTAGFHIHVGYENTTKYPKELINIAIARCFDFFTVLPAKKYYDDYNRNATYGGFGKFRHKPYGIELRSLGSYFTKDHLLEWVYGQTIKAVSYVLEHDNVEKFLDLETNNLNTYDANDLLGIDMKSEQVIQKYLPKILVT